MPKYPIRSPRPLNPSAVPRVSGNRAVPPKKPPQRLPDGSTYLTTYDATTGQWYGILLTGTPEKMATFRAALHELVQRHVEAGNGDVARMADFHGNLFGLLTKMDANYRA
jgi:hypothetical protein